MNLCFNFSVLSFHFIWFLLCENCVWKLVLHTKRKYNHTIQLDLIDSIRIRVVWKLNTKWWWTNKWMGFERPKFCPKSMFSYTLFLFLLSFLIFTAGGKYKMAIITRYDFHWIQANKRKWEPLSNMGIVHIQLKDVIKCYLHYLLCLLIYLMCVSDVVVVVVLLNERCTNRPT